MGANINDGYFEIKTGSDGIYLEVLEAKKGGKNVEIQEITNELKNMNIETYDLASLEELLKMEGFESIEMKIAEPIEDSNEDDDYFRIEISENKMSAYITFYKSSRPFNKEEIIKDLGSRGVKHGVDMELLEALVAERELNNAYLIAKGTPPTHETEAVIEHYFKTENDVRPTMDEDGNVNYHKLNVIAHVKEGQLLSRLIPGTQGIDGIDLHGNLLTPKKAKVVKLKYGKNISLNEDKTEITAACDGLVKIIEDKVVVNDAYDVPNNVGNSTGDIDFDGTVIVHGNVITGFKVKARGDIEVLGVVEGAEIISGGSIILHKGIQGMGKSNIQAANNIKAKYIENANVTAGGDVHSEAILHSMVTCKGTITVEGKKGMISGGTVRAGQGVTTRILGSHMGTVTNVEVGIDPIMLSEYGELKREIPKMESELSKLEQVIQLLNKRKEIAGKLDDDKQEMYMSAVRNKIFLTNKLNQGKKKFETMQTEVENKNAGVVKVSHELYTGVKISIGNISTHIRDEIKGVIITKKGADIKVSSL
ncbi:DUF342 domain-containing protein [Petrocella sp. FN5]|uniref:DUF342 domain-containing protein n=1 Tax=Petrocella sp. FN5 TaxID=3032002 RepID=UPI0023D9AFEC|nr:FapA family protein [Petrocella sp. FN5]MDF1616799.1 FapA family protein [Petrocella sp. FN5]